MANEKEVSKQDKSKGEKNSSALDVISNLIESNQLSANELDILKEARNRLTANSHGAQSATVGLWSWVVGSETVQWNKSLKEIFELENDVITTTSYWQAVHPEDVEQLQKTIEKAIALNSSYRIGHRIVTKSGLIKWLDCQGKISVDSSGSKTIYGICRLSSGDFPNKLSSSTIYKILSDHSSEIITNTDLDGKITDVNVAIFEQLGWFPDEIVGKSIWSFVHDDQHKPLMDLWEDAMTNPKYEWLGNVRIRTKSGRYVWFAIKSIPIAGASGKLVSMLMVLENLEKGKLLANAIGGNENRFSGISEEISEFAIVALDANNRIKLWNKGAQRIFKFIEEEVAGRDFLRLMKPMGIEKTSPEEIFNNAFVTKQKKEWYGWMKVKGEEDFWGHIIITPQLDSEGEEILGFVLLIRNLSERKFSDARFQSFLEMASDAIVIIDEKGEIYLVNRKTEETFGYHREELLGQKLEILVPDAYKGGHKKHREGFFKNPAARPMGKGLDLFAKRKNGDIFPVEISLSPVQTEKGLLVLSSIRDVSQRLENERKLRNAARELNLAYQRLQGIIDSSQDLIAAVDVNNNFIAFNQAFKAYFDQRHEVDIQPGDNIKSIFSVAPKHLKVLEPYWERALRGQEFSFEIKAYSPDNSELYQNVTFNSIRDQNKRLLGAAHVIRDITEDFRQKEILKRSEEMLNDAQTFARIGSFEYDIKLNAIYCSDGVYQLLGIPKQKLKVDADLLRLVIPEDRQKITDAFLALIEEGKSLHELFHLKRVENGVEVVLSCTARTRITANGNPGIIGVIQDETKDYRVQKELKEAKEKAEETAKLKQFFVANVSHEIRTPMNAILGFSRFLMEANMQGEMKDYAGNIYESAENLLVLIDDILDFSKLEAGKLRVEHTDFNLRNTLSKVQTMFALKAKQKNIDLNLEVAKDVAKAYKGDPFRINQMLINLIGNALKFTEKGGVTIKANVENKQKAQHLIAISVVDTGIGIPKDKLQTIFQSFSQAEGDTTRKYGGTGLGLSIVSSLLEVLNGSIDVESEVGKGSTFTIKLPLSVGDEKNLPSMDSIEVERQSGEGYSILVAEDNGNNQIITAKLLRDMGFEVVVADNGAEAVEQYASKDFHLVLMDIQMPVMDGLEALKQIKLLQKNKPLVPIIALTAHALVEEKNRYLNAGMTDYLAKPFKPDELYQVVFRNLKVPKSTGPSSKRSSAKGKKKEEKSTNKKLMTVDLTFLREMVGEDQDVIDEMVDIFKEDTPNYLRAIDEGLKESDWEKIAKTCHTLKSSVGFMGRTDLVALAQQLQLQKTEPAADDPIREKLDTFVKGVNEVLKYLKEHPDITKKDPSAS